MVIEKAEDKLDRNIKENPLARVGVTKPYTVFVLMMVVIILGVFSFTKFKLELMPNMNLPYVMVISAAMTETDQATYYTKMISEGIISPADPELVKMQKLLEHSQNYALLLEAEYQQVSGLTIQNMQTMVLPNGVISMLELEYGQDARTASIRLMQAAQRVDFALLGFPKPDVRELGLDMAPVFAFTTTCSDQSILRELEIALTGANGVAEVSSRIYNEATFNISNGYTLIGKPGQEPKKASFFSIQKASSAVTTDTCESIEKVLTKFKDKYKAKDFDYIVTMNQGGMIKTSINDVLFNLLLGGLLSIIILFLFMRSWKMTLVVALAIPISVIGAFIFMYFMGIGLNIVSMSGLALVVGMLVDNSVIVLENIFRLRQKGMPIREAAIKGASQIFNAVIAATLTTVAVFFPMFFVSGLIMDVFMDLVWVVILALVASLIVAVCFVPAIVSSFKVGEKPKHEFKWITRMNNGINKALGVPTNAIKRAYDKTLGACIKWRWVTCVVVICLFVGSLVLGVSKGFELMPATDSGQFSVSLAITRAEGDRGANSDIDNLANKLTTDIRKELEKELGNDLESISTTYGGSAIQTVTSIRDVMRSSSGLSFSVKLKDKHSVSTKVASQNAHNNIVKMLKNDTYKTNTYFLPERVSTSGGGNFNSMAEDSVTVTIAAPTEDSFGTGLGANMKAIEKAIKNDSTLMNDVFMVEVDQSFGITRNNGRVTQSLKISLKDGVTISKVQSRVDEIVDGLLQTNDFKGYTKVEDGFAAQMNETVGQMLIAIIIGILLVYLVMVAMFQSFRLPFVVLITVPLAFTGGFLLLFICGMPISIVAMIGFIVLTGVIVNNGIVLIDYINKAREDGLPVREAVVASAKVRARPILITMLTTVIALIPSAIGLGANGALMQPLAIVSIGGLIYATAMSLLVVPCFYTLMFFKKDKQERKEIKNETSK